MKGERGTTNGGTGCTAATRLRIPNGGVKGTKRFWQLVFSTCSSNAIVGAKSIGRWVAAKRDDSKGPQ